MIEKKTIVARQNAIAAMSIVSQSFRLNDDDNYEFIDDSSEMASERKRNKTSHVMMILDDNDKKKN